MKEGFVMKVYNPYGSRMGEPLFRSRRQAFGNVLFLLMLCLLMSNVVIPTRADNFTDVFYTNSFRGSFEWFSKMDWVGMIVQAVISIFALVGTALIILRIMTSMLYLSARGLWEEVHDLKQSGGGESEMYDFGMINMAKTWAKGKAGTGLDAIFGAVLVLLPDVKRYSDFGEKSGQKFEEDTSIAQYILKILLPTILSVFFLAMAFNGTLVKGIAVSVDALGTVADHAVSVNYAGFVDDLINQNTGYKFVASMDGTNLGALTGQVQREVYGKVIANVKDINEAQLYAIGQNIESMITKDSGAEGASTEGKNVKDCVIESTQVTQPVRDKISGDDNADAYFTYVEPIISVNGSQSQAAGAMSFKVSDLIGDTAKETLGGVDTENAGMYNQYINITFKQNRTFDGRFINTSEVQRPD